MSNWNIYIFSGSSFPVSASDTIPRPNEDMAVSLIHNQQKFKLADGDDAFVTPDTRTSPQQLTMVWYQQDKDFVDKIKGWMDDHEYIKIETHLASYNFIGRFISIDPVWKVGRDEEWDVTAVFEIMET